MNKISILGVGIDNLTMAEVLRKIEDFLADAQPHYIVTPNPEFLVLAQKDRQFKDILNQADLAVPDGTGLILAARFLRRPLSQRITGADLMEQICQKAAQKNWPISLLGAGPGVAETAGQNLKKKYPGIKIEKEAPILFVALGAPKQEKWIVNNLANRPSVKLAVGVGGAFDFLAGRVRRAPYFLRKIGLEWLWRLAIQPWRIKRIWRATVVFPGLIIKNGFKKN